MLPNEKMEKLIAAMEKMVREYKNGTDHPVDLQRVKLAIAELEQPEGVRVVYIGPND